MSLASDGGCMTLQLLSGHVDQELTWLQDGLNGLQMTHKPHPAAGTCTMSPASDGGWTSRRSAPPAGAACHPWTCLPEAGHTFTQVWTAVHPIAVHPCVDGVALVSYSVVEAR